MPVQPFPDDTAEYPEAGEAVSEVLERRNLTISAASRQSRIDRRTLTWMQYGYRPSLAKVEQFCRAFALDLNSWREMYDYPILGTPYDADAEFTRGIRAIAQELQTEVRISCEELLLQGATPAEVARALETIRARCHAEQSSRQARPPHPLARG